MSHKYFTALIVFCAGLGGILYGYDIGVISGALLFIQKTIVMTDNQVGFIVGAVLTGGLVGTLITGPLADRFGRRTMIIIACLIFTVGLVFVLLSNSFVTLLIARLLLGIAVGVVAVAVPLYLTEIAPASIRGRSVTLFQLLLTFGILLAYFVDLLFVPSGNWRGMFAVILIPSSILLISMLFLPETPRWLLSKNRKEQARQVLYRTRSATEAERELALIVDNLKVTGGSWKALFARSLWFPLMVALVIATCNQLTGINVLLQYAPLVIKSSGLSSQIGAMLGTIGIGAINFFGTIVSFFLIDRFGRKKLLIIGTAGIVLSYSALGIVASILPVGPLQAELTLLGFFAFIFFFAIGPGVVVWLAISELLPTKVRGKAVALSLFVNSLAASILSTIFLAIKDNLGNSGTYFLFAGFTTIYFFVAYFWLPETKGKTLEEIHKDYD
jgi:sugar porter (SP) family MFS transporter